MNPKLTKPSTSKRKAIALSQETLVNESFLRTGDTLPLLLEPAVQGLSLSMWAAGNADFIFQKLRSNGGILFRGFEVGTVNEFEVFLQSLLGDLFNYSYRSTPRTQVSGQIYTSTEYPEHQTIQLHNEMSYSRSWPMVVGFCCLVAPSHGGETPIANSRKVFEAIESGVRDRFIEKGVMYVRNYGDALDLSWRDVFQTSDRLEVERYCREAGIEFEWKGQNELQTRQVCQAVATHPYNGANVWFNQAHLFHVSSLEPEIKESLLMSTSELPRNAYYGDGSTIEEDALEEIRRAYANETIVFPWKTNDVLVLDNMLTAHGRRPYKGARRIVVGMG